MALQRASRLALLATACFLFFGGAHSWIPRFLRGRPRGGMLGVPTGDRSGKTVGDFPDMWITQKLDHFNDADTRYWKQRYFMNNAFYKDGGPVFLMIGGEGPASPVWMNKGAWIGYAAQYNALCFQVEHRYYGKSHPTADLSTDNLQFLNSEQALEDLAYFIEVMNKNPHIMGASWVSFGGSYSGALSAWLRLKYPHLVHAAVATSAPVYAQLNFKDYLGVVRDSLATTGPTCNKYVQDATTSVEQALETASGRQNLKNMFKLCNDIDPNNKLDIANLMSTLVGNLEGVVQYNRDNRAFEGAIGTNITITTLCDIMNDNTQGQPIQRFANINTMMLHTYNQTCTDFVYKTMIADLQKTDWNSSGAEGGRQWTYQTCTEFGYFQSSDLQDQPFGHLFPLNFSVQQCIDIYGAKFNNGFISKGIASTNTNYGGFNLKATRIVLPNGSIDPWHALGITETLGPDAIAIYINGTAHCANMYPPAGDDLPDLIQARFSIGRLIGKWLMPHKTSA